MRSHSSISLSAAAVMLSFFTVLAGAAYAADPLDPGTSKGSSEADSPLAGEKFTPGTISSTGGYRGAVKIDQASTGEAAGDDPSVITGSISRSGRNSCTAKVTNSSKKNKYSISFKVIGTNKRGTKVLNRTFSAVIKPEQTISRNVSGCAKDLNLALNVVSGRAILPPKEKMAKSGKKKGK